MEDNIYPWNNRTYEDFQMGRCTTPLPTTSLLSAGGKRVGSRGVSRRLIIRMPNDEMFVQGLDLDGACYIYRPEIGIMP